MRHQGATFDNIDNLAGSFLTTIRDRYAGTRLGRQELMPEILDDVPGALWTREMIDRARTPIKTKPDFARVVVSVDPKRNWGGDEDDGDDIGIIVAAKGVDGRGYILADRTCSSRTTNWRSMPAGI